MQSANKHKNERGVVLILAALLMSVILAFVALAVDIARLASIQSEKLFTADSASLGALQAYIQSPPGTSHPDRLTRAFNRAETVTGFNFSTLGNHAQQAGAGELSSSSAGELLAGRSWIVRPPSCILPGCPCNLPINQVTDGCFQVCDADGCPRPDGDVSKPKLFATAISLELRTQGGGESRNALGSIIGAGSTPIRAKSFAASRSSHGIILLDVSSSTKLDGTTPLQPLTNIVNLAAAITSS